MLIRETEVKLKEKQNERDNELDSLRKRFPKHLYDSEAEESDYELHDHDLNPPQFNPNKRASSE